MRLNSKQRKEVIDRTRLRIQKWYDSLPPQRGPLSHYCLFWAFFTVESLIEAGVKDAIIQAGTAYWPIIDFNKDDGVSPTRFGFEFEWNAKAMSEISMGVPPEMHCWTCIPPSSDKDPPEIIDVTTKYFKERTQQMGYKYSRSKDPPDYFWWNKKNLPQGVVYNADPQAIEIAIAFLRNAITGEPLSIKILNRKKK